MDLLKSGHRKNGQNNSDELGCLENHDKTYPNECGCDNNGPLWIVNTKKTMETYGK